MSLGNSALKSFSDNELREELKRREEVVKNMPQPIMMPDFAVLIKYVSNSIKAKAEDGYETKDFEHHVFELVMEAIYGKQFWYWWNKQS
jgi:hypothetical protein